MKVPNLKGIKFDAAKFKPQLQFPEYFERYPVSVALSFFLIILSPLMLAINLVFSILSLAGGLLLISYIIVLVEYSTEKELMINPPAASGTSPANKKSDSVFWD